LNVYSSIATKAEWQEKPQIQEYNARFTALWSMPFERSADFTFVNQGKTDVRFYFHVLSRSYSCPPSMHFYANGDSRPTKTPFAIDFAEVPIGKGRVFIVSVRQLHERRVHGTVDQE